MHRNLDIVGICLIRKKEAIMAFLESEVQSLHLSSAVRKGHEYSNSVFSPVVDIKQGTVYLLPMDCPSLQYLRMDCDLLVVSLTIFFLLFSFLH